MRKHLAFAALLVGLFDSIYLTWAYTSESHKLVCLGTGCDLVRSSAYAYPWGVPLPVFGLVFYAVMALLALADAFLPQRSETLWRWIMTLSGAGVLFSAWLTYLEAFVIHGWCAWCVVQAIAVLIVFLLSLSLAVRPPEIATGRRWIPRVAILVIAIAAGVPAMMSLTRHSATTTAQSTAPVTPEDAGKLVRPDSYWTGNPNAKLTIVEFGDFQCPSCGVAEKTNRAIRDQFGDKIKFVFRQFPLTKIHAYALTAAKASECAGQQDKFWPMAETLYDNQTNLAPQAIQKYAVDLGLNGPKFDACMTDPKTDQRIQRDVADGMALDVRATPTFFLNGKKTEGALSMMEVAGALSAASKSGTNAANTPTASSEPRAAALSEESKESKAASGKGAPVAGDSAAKGKSVTKAPVTTASATPPSNSGGFPGSGSGSFFSAGSGGCSLDPPPDPPMVRTAQARELFEKKSALFIDIRPPAEFAKARIPDATNVPMDELQTRIGNLPKDKSLVLYEAGTSPGDPCALSKNAARLLIEKGFKQVHVYQDGLAGWRKDGLPVVP